MTLKLLAELQLAAAAENKKMARGGPKRVNTGSHANSNWITTKHSMRNEQPGPPELIPWSDGIANSAEFSPGERGGSDVLLEVEPSMHHVIPPSSRR